MVLYTDGRLAMMNMLVVLEGGDMTKGGECAVYETYVIRAPAMPYDVRDEGR